MADRNLNVKLIQLTKTTDVWASFGTIIPAGMLCIEQCVDGTTKQKVGDGTHTFAELAYTYEPTLTGASMVLETGGEPADFDPTKFYKKVGNNYVLGTTGEAWAKDTWYRGTDGVKGSVPAPTAVDVDKFLKGDGTWANVPATVLYKMTADKYVLLASEPENWSTNYTDYYTKSGNTYSHVSGSSAPTFETDTYYKYDSTQSSADAFRLQVSTDNGTTWSDAPNGDVQLGLFNENSTIIRSALLPSYVDDVIEGYFHYILLTSEPTSFDPTDYFKIVGSEYVKGSEGDEWAADTWYTPGFFEDNQYTTQYEAEAGKIYIDLPTNSTYRAIPGTPEVWVNISNPLSVADICTLLQITYASDATVGDMVGTNGSAAGAHGFVPAPATTDADKFLKSTGSWAEAIEPTDNLTLTCVASFT